MIRLTLLIIIVFSSIYFFNKNDFSSTIERVDIEGQFINSNEKLITEKAKLFIGKNLYDIDLRYHKSEFEKMSWVKNSQISIKPPNRLVLKIVEHTPLFLWNESSYVNKEMYTFVTPNLPIENILRLSSNDDSYESVYELYQSIQSYLLDIDESIHALSKQDDMLDIRTKNLTIIVRYSRYQEKMREFVSIYPDLKSKLKNRKKIHVDLRYATGFAVR